MRYLSDSSFPQAQTRPVSPELQDLHSVFASLYRRRWLALLVFSTIIALTIGLTLSQRRMYTTEARLIINHTAPISWGQSAPVPVISDLVSSDGSQSVETYVALMESDEIANEVRNNLKLSIGATALSKQIKIKPLTNTNILALAVSWPDPDESARIANEYARVSMEHERSLAGARAREATRYLARALDNASKNLERAESEAAAFTSKSAIPDANAQTTSLISELSALDEKIAALEADQRKVQAQLVDTDAQLRVQARVLEGQTNVARNPVASQLAEQLAQVDGQLQSALAQYTDAHPVVVSLRQRREILSRQLASLPATTVESKAIIANPIYQHLQEDARQWHAQIFGDSAELASMVAKRKQLFSMLSSMPPTVRHAVDLQRIVKTNEETYSRLKEKYDQAVVGQTVATSDISLVKPADARAAVRTPKLSVNLAIGAVVGLTCALLCVLLVEATSSSIRTERDVENVLEVPVLATLGGSGKQAVALRHFAARLAFADPGAIRTLTLASPSDPEGMASVALSTAIELAAVRGPVLLVDANFERPSLHKLLGVRNVAGCGFTDVLAKRAQLTHAVLPTALNSLDFLAAGTQAPDEMSLLSPPKLGSFVEQALMHYAAVVFDTSALDCSASAIALAAQTDATVLVVSADTKAERAREALRRLVGLSGVNVLGVFLDHGGAPEQLELASLGVNPALPARS